MDVVFDVFLIYDFLIPLTGFPF